MALSRQSLSPTSHLLRNSRLFSLPNPLPRPPVSETFGAGITKASDTATLPYPTHQAIATTKASLARGDWGLKRAIPSRSHLVQVSDPVLRVTQLDTIEHVTDFDSAADHVRTRQKWEEMGIPMMKGMTQMRDHDLSVAPPAGAFEVRDDTTNYDTDMGLDEADPIVHNTKRWKHDGPWLPGMGADDFVAYISKEINSRKKEFNSYLVEFVKNEIYTSRRLAAAKSKEQPPMDIKEAEEWQERQEKAWRHITRNDINNGIKALRKETANNPLGSKLVSKLILPFLKLPAIKFKPKAWASDASSRDIDQYSFDQETAPLSTHPSAGLGYLRTKSYMANHPILGPQASHAPVPARVVQARRTGTKNEMYARLGVGGFVANDQFKSAETMSASRANIMGAKDVETIDIDTPGGRKIPVQPLFGSVTNDGRIHIKLKRSIGPEVAVARGELDDRPPVRDHVDEDPLRSLGAGMGKSGIKELDEQSGEAQRFSQFLESMTPQGKASPPPGFPGVADALRSD
ncbi:hypothetical protein COCVIDRAFT_111011 [Bipolaris victoriae FI3]|uniref:Mitochondrial ribosomal protein MRP51 n=2 Tax=Bipolaris TaxID=33194 RepID=W6YEM2_COCC2|nr:uncharacterized protein COCCADRAFT_88926 [Bipolaris zeicola 26-R-13]XP_014552177.1 hypothetical protein COCVIDRAFT_111011 [Bipolaris victoriae FI3]EUC36115.1 hypothetical protein COCCADRAFT_88926 [Bipolaris zeicola 26-R-13]